MAYAWDAMCLSHSKQWQIICDSNINTLPVFRRYWIIFFIAVADAHHINIIHFLTGEAAHILEHKVHLCEQISASHSPVKTGTVTRESHIQYKVADKNSMKRCYSNP